MGSFMSTNFNVLYKKVKELLELDGSWKETEPVTLDQMTQIIKEKSPVLVELLNNAEENLLRLDYTASTPETQDLEEFLKRYKQNPFRR